MPAAPATAPGAATPAAAHWELVRALGAALLTPPPHNRGLCDALDLPRQSAADHTETFILSLPPHAAIHLGNEGKLGGEGLDRVAGFWRALRLDPPEDADHLGTLLMLYAELGEAERTATGERGRGQLRMARQALLREHLRSWAPGYLAAVVGLGVASTRAWARLTWHVLRHEAAALSATSRLPLALRQAPAPVTATAAAEQILDAAVAPIRSGLILTHRDLAACAAASGGGLRRGERRYALTFLLQQDRHATIAWLARHATSWSRRHRSLATATDPTPAWWAARAAHTADALTAILAEPADDPDTQAREHSPSRE